jgi:hypothetical protein
MSLLTTLAATLGTPPALFALVLISVSLLELERHWTRTRRFAGMQAGAPAFVLDGLAILAALLVVIGIVLMLTQAIVSVVQYTVAQISGLAWQIDGTAAGLTLGVTIALIALLGLIRRMTVRLPSATQRAERAEATLARRLALDEPHPPFAPALPAAPDRATSSDLEEEPHLVMLRARRAKPRSAPTPAQPWLHGGVQPEPKPSTRRFHPGVMAVVALLLAVGAVGVMYRDTVLTMLADLETQAHMVVPLPLGADVPASTPAPTVFAPVAPPSAPQMVQVVAERLNLRAGPGTNYPVLATLRRGDEVEPLGETTGSGADVWIRVRSGTQEGWVFRAFLREPTSPSP